MMFIKYWVPVKDFQLSRPVQFSHHNKYVRKVELKALEGNKDKMNVTFFLVGIDELKKAKSITIELMKDIINVLSFRFNWIIGDPHCYQYNINGTTFHEIEGHAAISSHFNEEFENQYGDLETWLSDPKLTKFLSENIYFRLYKEARKIEDPVLSFMFLYSILYYLKGSQAEVDNFISVMEKDVEWKESLDIRKQEKNQEETIYTWLRNYIGHTGEDTDLSEIINQIIIKNQLFFNLVKTAIKEDLMINKLTYLEQIEQ